MHQLLAACFWLKFLHIEDTNNFLAQGGDRMENIQFFGVSLRNKFIPIYEQEVENSKDSKEFQDSSNLDLAGLSINELKQCLNENGNIMDEYLCRVQMCVFGACKFTLRKFPYLSLGDLYGFLQDTAVTAFKKYSGSKGKFERFFNKMLQMGSWFFRTKEGKEYAMRKKHLGFRISYIDSNTIDYLNVLNSQCDFGDVIRLKVDLETYCSQFTDEHKHMLHLYFSSYTFRQIAAKSHLPLSTVSYFIRTAMSRFTKTYFVDGAIS